MTTRSPWLTLAAVCSGFFLLLVDSTIVAVAIPAIAADLRVSESSAVWVNSGYLFAYAVPLLIAGRWGDRYGARRVFLWGLVIFVLASLWCGLAPSLPMLLLARIAQGLGAALMTPQMLTILRHVFEAPRLPLALGVWGSIGGIAAVTGPIAGGLLVDAAGWPAIFLINLPLGAVALAMSLAWIPRLPSHAARVPVFTTLASAVAIFLIVFVVHEAPAGTVPSPLDLILLGTGLVLLVAAFAGQPRDPRHALIPAELLRSRGFVAATAAATAASFVVGSALIPVLLHLQSDAGLSPSAAALVLAPMGVISALSAPFAGFSVARFGPRTVSIVGSIALAGSVGVSALLVDGDATGLTLSIPLGVFGFANSFLWAPLSSAAITSVSVTLTGAASGAYNATRQLGAVLGSATVAGLLVQGSPALALFVLSGVGAFALIAASLIPSPNHPEQK